LVNETSVVKFNTQTLTFTLRPKQDNIILPPYCGHIVRGVVLKLIQEANPEISAEMHKDNAVRPYSLSTIFVKKGLLPRNKQGRIILSTSDQIQFRFQTINQAMSQSLVDRLISINQEPLVFANQKFELESVKFQADTFTDRQLIPSAIASHFSINFITPTQFNLKGLKSVYLFPEPKILFPHLLRMGSALGIFQAKLNEDAFYEFITKNLFVRAYKIRTREVSLGKGLPFVGFTGWTRFKIQEPQHSMAKLIPVLLKLGFFLHVGNKRTAGLGEIKYEWSHP